MIKPTTKQIASNESTNAPQLQFSSYEQGKTYKNDGTLIDFVTDGKSLYVCAVEMAVTTENTIEQEIELHGNFLKVISQGEQGAQGRPGDDGAPGATPNLTFKFDGKQLVISENGQRKAVSPDLAGPSWRPVLNGRSINWTLSKDTTAPQPLNIDDITVPERPLLLRTDSDNTRRLDEESGPARFIQWKYEGEEEWRNLISISELMNLALAGVSFWREEDGWHFGHKEVISATYESDASGNQIISNVELGNVLFDAGTIPASLDGDALAAAIQALKDRLDNLNVDDLGDLTNVFATKDWVRDGFQPKGNYQPAGNYLTEHQSLANYATKSEIPTGVVKGVQVNDEQTQTPDSNGIVHLTVTGGNGTLNPEDLSEYAQKTWVNSRFVSNETLSSTLNNYASKTWVNDQGFLKNVDLNGFVRTVNNISPVNGNITIDIADNPIMNLYIGQDGHLYKRSYRDNQDVDLGVVGGTGDPTTPYVPSGLTEAQVKSIVGRILEGLELPTEYTHTDGHTYFIRTVDLQDYTTFDNVRSLIQAALEDAWGVDYYNVFTLYQRTSSSTDVPLRPTVGIWSWSSNSNVLVCSNPNTPWKNHPENAAVGSEYLWMTSATFSHQTGRETGSSTSSVNNGVYTYPDDYAWSNPICLTGEGGKDGEDGAGVEFVYHLGPKDITPTIDILRASKNGETPKSFVNTSTAREWWASYGTNGSNDWQPGDGNNGYWTDDPTGIDDEPNKKAEYASVRTSRYDPNLGTSIWSDFSSPFIWSMWGEDGMDGAGVEYIFCVTATQEEKPVISALIPRIGQTYNNFDSLFPNYQNDDWYPKDGMGNANRWTDNPLDVDENQPYEWVAIRKKTTNPATGESSWGYFSDPKVWGLWGSRTTIINQPSESYFTPYTCYAFTRTNISNFDRNYIVQTTWESAGQTYADWIAQDQTRDYNFRANPLNYLVTKRRDGNNWVIDGTIQWYDTVPDGTEQLYIISNHIGDELGGVETGWDGPTKWGDQAGLQIEYAVSDEYSDAVYNRQKTLYNLSKKENGVAVYETDDPTRDHDGDGIDESLWRDHVRSANMGTWGDIDETPGSTYYVSDPDYMACCMKQSNGLWTDWQVIKVKGEQGPQGNPGTPGAAGADGTDIEFIYYRTKENFTPGISTTEYKLKNSAGRTGSYIDIDDALPKVSNYNGTYSDGGQYWHDNPMGVTEEYPYEWTSTRRSYYTNGVKHWEAFYTPATVWSKWGANGQDGDGVEYIFYLVDADAVVYNSSTGKWSLKSHAVNSNVYWPDNSWAYDDPQNGWSDDPKGVTEDYPYEFVSVRRYDGSTETWLPWSTPALWTKWAKDGVNGEKGEDGKSFVIRDSVVVNEDYYDCSSSSASLSTVLDRLRRDKNPQDGDAVVIQIEGGSGTPNENKVYKNEIWSWTGEAVSGHTFVDPDDGGCDVTNKLVHGWKRVGDLMAGNAYIHTKFANVSEAANDAHYDNDQSKPKYRAEVQTPDGVLRLELTQIVPNVTTNKGEFPGAYIGIYTDLVELDSDEITRYTWTKWSGDDGWGMEQIFALGNSTDNIPPQPTFSGTSKVLLGSQQYTGNALTRDVYDTYDAIPAFLTAKGNTQVWYDRPLSPNPNNPICYCSIRKLDNPNLKEWTTPVEYSRYTRDGVDGDTREYIYHIYDEEVPTSVLTNFANQMLDQTHGWVGNQQVNGNDANGRAQKDFLPKDYDKKPNNGVWVNAGTTNAHWTDNPTGVSAEHPYEYYSFRDITTDSSGNKTYDLFCKPMIWSHFGENGKDGDGIEYVFFALTEAEHLAVKLRYQMGQNDEYLPYHNLGFEEIVDRNGLTYLQDEYLPELQIMTCNGNVSILEALDDNPGPSLLTPYIYYSTRKEVNGSWFNVEFSEIKEWKDADYKAEIKVAKTKVDVQSTANGTIINDSDISVSYDLRYDRESVGDIKYWDILVHNEPLTNTITLNNGTYTYDGALRSKDMRFGEIQSGGESGIYRLLYKWRNGSTLVYTTDLYPSTNDYAFNSSGAAIKITGTSNLNLLGAKLSSSPNYTSGTLTIRPSILLGNKDSETITLIGNFWDMYEKYDYVNIEVFKQKTGQDGSPGSAYILETNYKTINLSNIPTDFKARVLNNGNIDNTWSFNVSFKAGNTNYDGQSYRYTNNGVCSIDIEAFMSTVGVDSFDSLTITATKSGFANHEVTIPTVQNGSSGVPYFFRGEWQPNTVYYHNNQRIDIVKYTNNNVSTYYICSVDGNGQQNKVPGANSQYWETFDGNYENIATDFIFAEGGYIEKLRVRSTQIDGELKVAEVEASDLGHGKITINRGGAHWNGDSQILLWAHGANNPGITISGETLNTLSTPVSSQVSVGNVSQNQYSTGKYPLIGSNYQNQADVETFIRNNYNNIVKTGYFSTGNITNNTYESVQIQLTNCTGNWTFKDSNGMDWTYDDGYGLGLYVSSLDAWLCSGSGNNVNVIEYLGPISSGIYRDDAGSTYAIMGSVTFNNSSVKATSFTNSGSNLFIAILPGVDNNLYDPDTGPGGNIANSELWIDFAGTVTLNLKTAGSGQIINPGITMAPNGIRIWFDNNNYFEFLKLGNSNTASSTMVVGGTTKFQY